MNLKKNILLVLSLICVLAFVAACGQSGGGNASENATDTDADKADTGSIGRSEIADGSEKRVLLSGTVPDDFAYSAFKAQIDAMGNDSDGMFTFADNEADGNLSFREREGYKHDGFACDEYTYNGLRFFWNGDSDDGENAAEPHQKSTEDAASVTKTPSRSYDVEMGTEEYKGFILDNVLYSEAEGDIHYNVYIPDSYDGSEPYALFMTLPGYQGLYFQGVGMNVQTEEFGFVAQDYNPKMIIVAPQLNDWGRPLQGRQ